MPSHAQPTEDTLDDNGDHSDCAQPFYPQTILDNYSQNTKRNCQQTDAARDKSVGVLEKYTTDPTRNREQEHVVPEAIRPIRHCHPGSVTCNQPTTADQNENAGGNENSVPVQESLLNIKFSHRFHWKRLVHSNSGSLRCRLILWQIVFFHSRNAIFVRPMVYGRGRFKIPVSRRRRNRPLERRRPPGIIRSFWPFEHAVEEDDQKWNRR